MATCFEKDGEIYKHIPAGGHGGGITGAFVVKASKEEIAAFRTAQHGHGLGDVEKATEQLEHAVQAAEQGTANE